MIGPSDTLAVVSVPRTLFMGSFPPRECGIATFTKDVVDSFDRAFAIHCIYFWREPAVCLREIRRVLRPEGVVAHYHSPDPSMARAEAAD